MISSAYQYFLSEYGRMETSRYDTHKKSELKQSYNKLISTNKNTPLFRFNLSNETTNVLIDLKENSRIFHNRLYEIFGSSDSEGDLQRKSPYTSLPDALDVDYIGNESGSDTESSYLVKVKQLATPQVNVSDFVPSASLGLKEGDYSFDLNVGDNAYEFQFKVNEGSTNIALQEKLSRLINRSHIGLNANVITDGNGSSALEISSVATGSKAGEHLFFFSDDNSSAAQSGSVKFLGLNNISKFSKNAVIEVDGTELTSTNNTFIIDQTFQLNVKQVTPEGEFAEIGFQRLPETISDELQLFANTYNNLYRIAEQDSTSGLVSRKLGKELAYISNNYNSVLETIGLSKDSDGYMKVDEALVLQSAKDGTLDNSYSDLISFQHQLLNKTSQISTNPFEYLKKTVISYPNPKSPSYTPYHTADYTGLLFDGAL